MERKFAFVSSSLAFVLGVASVAGCGGAARHHAYAARPTADSGYDGCTSDVAHHDASHAPQRTLRGDAVGSYNKGYVDGVGAAAFFNNGRPLTDEQVDRLIEIGRRQGDPTGPLALEGYADGYRTGAKHLNNPYRKQMTSEQVAQVRKAQGLPPIAEPRSEDHRHSRTDGSGNAEASAR